MELSNQTYLFLEQIHRDDVITCRVTAFKNQKYSAIQTEWMLETYMLPNAKKAIDP